MAKNVSKVKDENKLEEKKRVEQEKKEHFAKRGVQKKQMEGVRGIVRVCETNIDGTKKISQALLRVKGVGYALGNAVTQMAGFAPDIRIGALSDEQIEKLEEIIVNPVKYGLPAHMVNRVRETFTGESHHLVESDLALAVKTDIDFMKKIRCYKGVRHEIGQPVRGQRTRSSFRTGIQVGVARKGAAQLAKAAEGGAPAPAGKGAAPAAGAKPAAAPAGKAPASAAGKTAPAAGAKPAVGAAKTAAPAKKEEKK